MKVPFVDFREQILSVKDEVMNGIENIIQKGNFILGDEAKCFEKEFAAYCDAQYAVGVNSGTDALFFALSALGIGPGDEVILPTHSFIATALCVSYTGATPVWADIDESTYTIDPQAIKKAITARTKAVIPVHLYGQPADMDEINNVIKNKGIHVVEDAAQAHGAFYKNRRVGSLGTIACFSFYPTKNLGAFGDAGMAVTGDPVLHDKLMMLRDYGRTGRYEHKIKGHNSRLDTIQAVGLSAKLKRLDEWNKMRQEVARWYFQELKGISEVILPKVAEDRTCVYHLFVVRVPERDQILERLKEKEIGVLIHYPIPIHLQEAYKDAGYKKGDFPVTEKIAGEIISLPMFPHMSREQVKYVCDCLKESL
ncbi:MAG: DegT/DnrJ/EryC1/StrS family aminotransferase [Candidatus Omnitrophota bacterium]